MIPRFFLQDDSYLVWTPEEVRILRENFDVIGFSTTTSPWYPNQSNELVLPFKFSVYEVRYCFDRNYCKIVRANFKNHTFFTEDTDVSFDFQKVFDEDEFTEEIIDKPPVVDEFKYRVYCDLKEKGFCVCDGVTYGYDFTVYRRKPWNSHSYSLVWCETNLLDTRKLVQKVRTSEQTSKNCVIATLLDNDLVYINVTRFKFKEEDT